MQREAADVAGVTEDHDRQGRAAAHVRIRNRCKELAEKLDIDIIL